MSEILKRAQKYEKEMMERERKVKPVFHVTAPIGRINDPNGFSWYRGKYHLFCWRLMELLFPAKEKQNLQLRNMILK